MWLLRSGAACLWLLWQVQDILRPVGLLLEMGVSRLHMQFTISELAVLLEDAFHTSGRAQHLSVFRCALHVHALDFLCYKVIMQHVYI